MLALMLRNLVFFSVLAPCLISAQGSPKAAGAGKPADGAAAQASRAKALDGAALTPFFTKRGAESVKKVMAGADSRKAEESVLDPLDKKQQPAQAGAPNPAAIAPANANSKPTQAPAEAPKFSWRLLGISYGKRHGMALFELDGKSKSVGNGAALDLDTKIISVSRSLVVLEFHGKRLEFSPW